MKKRSFMRASLLIAATFGFQIFSFATHLVGGDITVKYLSANNYEVKVTVFRDCGSSTLFDDPIYVGVYDKVTHAQQQIITMTTPTVTSVQLGNGCYVPSLCLEKAVYVWNVSIPNNANGYYLAYLRCCRPASIANIVNPGNEGFVAYCEIPDPAIVNSNPVFSNNPKGFLLANILTSDVGFQATDVDGDVLVYSFTAPLSCAPNGQCSSGLPAPGAVAGPYGTITWGAGYSNANPVGDPSTAINSSTGTVTVTAPNLGVYVIGVKVEEWRAGVKIGEIRRDLMFDVLTGSALAISSSPASPVCTGAANTLTATGLAGGFSYSWSPGGQTSNPITITPTSTGTYNYTVTATNGTCTVSATKTVTVNAVPAAAGAISGTGGVTQGQNGVAYSVGTIAGATSYTWSFSGTGFSIASGAGTNSITANFSGAATSGYLTVYGTSPCGTGAVSAGYPVLVTGGCTMPIVSGSSNSTICNGSSVTISATGSGTSGPFTYSWSPSAGLNNPTVSNPTASPTISTTYTCVVTDGAACTNSATVSVSLFPAPAAPSNNAATNVTCTSFTANWSAVSGALSYRLDVSAVPTFTTYVGSYNNLNVGNVLTYTVTGLSGSTNYYFRARAVDACAQSSANAAYQAVLTNSFPAAAGTISGAAAVSQNQTGVGYSVGAIANATSYTWNYTGTGMSFASGAGTNVVTMNFSGSATSGNLTVFGTNSCGNGAASANFPISVCISPTVTISSNISICSGTSTGISATGSGTTGPYTYAWSPSGTLSDATISNPTATPASSTTYTCVVSDATSCTNKGMVTVTVLTAPSAQSYNLFFSGVTCAQMTPYWTNGNGSNRIVVLKSGSAITGTPVNNTTYAANTIFGSGSTIAAGEYVVYNGSGTSVNVSGLSAGTYYCKIFEYNCSAGFEKYNITTPPSNSQTISVPSVAGISSPANGATGVCYPGTTLNWTAATGLPTGYKLYFGTDAGATNIINGTNIGNVLTYNPAATLPSTTYYWKIVPTNSCGDAAGAVIWSFTTGTILCLNHPSSGSATYTITGCAGNYYDNGGPSANYSDNIASSTVTLYPGISTDKVNALFNSFSTESATCATNYDWLKIYNGNSTAAPLLNCYSTGGTVPTNITSSAVDGSLTFQFKSDASATASGWSVTLSCVPPPAWKSQWISMSTGAASWCAGETRNISVTVKNDGTATWTDAAPDVNIGCKWNADADYFIRANGNSLAPGANGTYTFNMTAPATGGSNNLTFDVVKESDCWFAGNTGSCGPGNVIYTSTAVTINTIPSCATISSPASGATGVCTNSTSLNWNAASGPPSGYKLYFGTDAAATNIVNGTNLGAVLTYAPGILNASTVYYWKIVPLNSCGTASGCSTYSFTTGTACYCTPSFGSDGCSTSLWISNFTTTSGSTNINNTTGCTPNPYYANYSAQVVTVTSGNSFNINIAQPGTYTMGYRIWIDLNNDKDFADAGEAIWSGAPAFSGSGSITVPSGTIPGLKRMRVIAQYNAIPAANAADCGAALTYGETEDYSVNVNCSPASVSMSSNVTFCTGSSSTLTATALGGISPYSYAWTPSTGLSNPGISNPVASPVSSTTYTCLVTDMVGCTKSGTVSVVVNPVPAITGTTPGMRCGPGSVMLGATATSGTINWYANSTGGASLGTGTSFNTPSISATTTYYVDASANGCISPSRTSVIATVSTLTTSISSTSINCPGGTNGSATLTTSGGTLPYLYSWTGGQTTSTATGLSAGNYAVNVSDALGCTKTSTVAIIQPAAWTYSITSTSPACGQADGTASVTITGGNPSYTYQWTNGDKTAQADSLAAGLYHVLVSDAIGCTKSIVVPINNLGAAVIAVTSVTDASCHGGGNGAIDISVTGGSPAYTYDWVNGSTTQDISNLTASPYEIEVTDAAGCKSCLSISVNEPAAVSISMSTQNASCGTPDGSATATASGGTGAFTYLWSTSATTSTITGLAGGNYSVTVMDNNGCTANGQTAINNNSGAIVLLDSIVPAGCNTGAGSVYVTISGGAPPYTYAWSNGATTQDLVGVPHGSYGLVVSGSNACLGAFSGIVPSQVPFSPVICMVTVDTATGTNQCIFEKDPIANPGLDHYNIYRETTASGVYKLVDSVQATQLSTWTDPIANPQQKSWRYKISAVDTCGTESPQSVFHKTIHLSVNPGLGGVVNLVWDQYEGYSYSTYIVWRHNTQWDSINAVAGNPTISYNSYTDVPPSFLNLNYFIEVRHPIGCTPSGKYYDPDATTVKGSKSNSDNKLSSPTLVNELTAGEWVNIYPNPNQGQFKIQSLKFKVKRVEVYNIYGEKVYSQTVNAMSANVSSGLPDGVYFVKAISEKGTAVRKIVISR